jgi:hypothetical protein
VRIAYALLGLAACDHVAGIHELPRADAPPACVAQGPHDDFTGPSPCQPWGAVVSDPQVMVRSGSGALEIQIDALGGQGGCMVSTAIELPDVGVFVEVPAPLDGSTAYTVFHAYGASRGDATATLVASSGGVVLADGDGVSHSDAVPTAQARWWRLRPTPEGIAGDLSPDGLQWTTVGTVTGTVGPVNVYLQAGVNTPGSTTGTARFAHFDVCP